MNSDNNDIDIAIIGISCKFPGASNASQFWDNIENGIESIEQLTDEELSNLNISKELIENPHYVKASAFIENIESFDAEFFGYTPRDAEALDPQHRLFLEEAWKAIENSGIDLDNETAKIGVFVGSGINGYLHDNILSNKNVVDNLGLFQAYMSNSNDFLATRISYKLNLTGPSVNVQTGCSTSLVAVHMACQSLLTGESDIALAGGVSISVPHKKGYLYQEGMIYSPDGHCRAFDKNAGGTVPSGGLGVIVIKLLSSAIADKDNIIAVIKGSSINNDGSDKIGYTAPSVSGQVAVISDALAMADVDPSTIGYIETHGTGTILGDSIELSALNKVYENRTTKKQFCALGSVKTNIGHADTASGIAGLIKTALALQKKIIPPSLNFKETPENIDLRNTPFYINTECKKWESLIHKRRAGISSFGIGGTNAHIIMEEAPEKKESTADPENLILLSAKSKIALEALQKQFATYLSSSPKEDISDIAYTLIKGRKKFNHRSSFVYENEHPFNIEIEKEKKTGYTGQLLDAGKGIVFMFSGQGGSHKENALELYTTQLAFRKQIDLIAGMVSKKYQLDIKEILFNPAQDNLSDKKEIKYYQVELFIIEYALFKLWDSWGIKPKAVIGHSLGEYTAACIAGIISLEDTIDILIIRGKLTDGLEEGKMLAVLSSYEALSELLPDTISIASKNSYNQFTISGSAKEINHFMSILHSKKIAFSELNTTTGFHSALVDPILNDFQQEILKIKINAPDIPFVSTVTGNWWTEKETNNPSYWIDHFRKPVLFVDAMEVLIKENYQFYLEIGPHNTLEKLVKTIKPKTEAIFSSLPDKNSKNKLTTFLLSTLGKMWVHGLNPNWDIIISKRQKVVLPNYPFSDKKYWVDEKKETENIHSYFSTKKQPLENWFYTTSWKRRSCNLVTKYEDPGNSSCLFLSNESNDLAFDKLKQSFKHVIMVIPGVCFEKIDATKIQINPYDKNDYEQLFDELKLRNNIPSFIIHSWNVTSSDGVFNHPENISEIETFSLNSIIFLVQALERYISQKKITLQLISNNAFEVIGNDLFFPEKNLLTGPLKTIEQEYPDISIQHIDISLPHLNHNPTMDTILLELLSSNKEKIISLRNNFSWVPVREKLLLPVPTENKIKSYGTYVITGGLGEIGLMLASYIAPFNTNIIIISKAVLPEKQNWDTIPEINQYAKIIKQLQKIESLGGNISYYSDNLSNIANLNKIVADINKRYRTIDGIFHLAGSTGNGIISFKTAEMTQKVTTPKVSGTINLYKAFSTFNFDFMILFSSLSSILNSVGQVDYSSANAFLDAYAQYLHCNGEKRVCAINWDTWKESGMAARLINEHVIGEQMKQKISQGITDKEGLNIIERIINQRLPQVIVSTLNLEKELEKENLKNISRFDNEKEKSIPDSLHFNTELEKLIYSVWQRTLKIDTLTLEDDFFDIGGNSLTILQIVSKLKTILNVEFVLKDFFTHRTIHSQAKFLEKIITNKNTILISENNIEEGEI